VTVEVIYHSPLIPSWANKFYTGSRRVTVAVSRRVAARPFRLPRSNMYGAVRNSFEIINSILDYTIVVTVPDQ
jgi:hypothetical protein